MILKLQTITDTVSNMGTLAMVVTNGKESITLTQRQVQLLVEELPKAQMIMDTTVEMMKGVELYQEHQ